MHSGVYGKKKSVWMIRGGRKSLHDFKLTNYPPPPEQNHNYVTGADYTVIATSDMDISEKISSKVTNSIWKLNRTYQRLFGSLKSSANSFKLSRFSE